MFSEQITDDDWKQLLQQYFDIKFALIDQVDPKEIAFTFDPSFYREVDLMIPYVEIFPCSALDQKIGDESLILVDYYCKNKFCNCSEVYFEVFKPVPNGEMETRNIGTLIYDYKNGQKNNHKG